MTFFDKISGLLTGKQRTLRKRAGALFLLVLFLLILLAVFFKARDRESKVLRGVISVNGTETEIMEGLFMRNGKDTLLLRSDALGLLSLDVFDTAESFIVRDKSHQIELKKDSGDYLKDSVLFSEDDSYCKPVIVGNDMYVDGDFIFEFFGLSPDYLVSKDKTTVKLYLSKADGADAYGDISLKERPAAAEDPEKTVSKEEEFVLSSSSGRLNPGELPTVPRPDEPEEETQPDAAETKASLDEGKTGQHEEDYQVFSEGKTKAEEASETPLTEPETKSDIRPTEPVVSVDMGDGRVNRTPERPQRKTEEEFEKAWSSCKDSLKNVFAGGTPSPGNVSWQQRTDKVIVFNPMRKAIYYDTVSVSCGLSDGTFISAYFCSDWSDMAGNTIDEGSAAYYRGIPGVYLNTFRILLGESEGKALFDYISSNADKTVTGGYEFSYDENGNLQSAWSDAMVSGDGLKASALDFSEWQDRDTSYGLRYSVNAEGDGLRVRIFKD